MTENIEVFTHNSIRIKTGGEGAENRNIYIDPFQMKIAPEDVKVFEANVKEQVKAEKKIKNN